MSEMVERVARAIADEMVGDWDRIPERSAGEASREDLRVAARLAIEAMRDPTDAMLAACRWHIFEDASKQDWQTMIDAALAE